ncbi:uncharacterized protein LOC116291986, partial [Actinia tenebrosa]|uniref:Uncharacterized protein LOC116291986 n=1 Tax=Actinia tenebrosa TaxID=6105 RepID=A0A6P8HQX3_ACTTE
RKEVILSLLFGLLVTYVLITSTAIDKKIYKALGHSKKVIVSSECHRTSLSEDNEDGRQKSLEDEDDEILCKPHRPSPKSCQAANSFFGSPSDTITRRSCSPVPTSDICWYTESNQPALVCSLDFCEDSRIYMARIDPDYGVIRKWEAITPFSTAKALEFVTNSRNQGDTFCYIKCAGFVRVIILPPKILVNTNRVDSTKKVNVNIIVLDSISRPHFYRVMRKSVKALRDIHQNSTIPASALDFELFQSISMHTFENIRPLFSGIIKANDDFLSKSAAAQEPLGIDVLFKHFKEYGYQTMFQEDLCWYDEWGIMLDNLERKKDSKPSIKKWNKFNKVISKHHLDHIGITHFSCEVFREYGYSNHYDRPSTVCFNGRFFSSYFLHYLRAIREGLRNVEDAAPMIMYHHFNTPHTETGLRVRSMDEELSKFIRFAAGDPYTWTILLSDHGHTRTTYGLTDEGLHERYNPLSFMIIPHKTAQLMGKDRFENLKKNQNRLLTTLDIHGALMTLNDAKKPSNDSRVSGVFAKISSNRTCSELPLMPLARCQCEGAEEKLMDNSPNVLWMAELALGTLNNVIQQQYSEDSESKSKGPQGFGKCVRFVGKSFTKIVQRNSGLLTTFDLHIDSSSVGLKDDEVFRVAVELTGLKPSLKFFDRQTLYNKFKGCADDAVELKLCMCDRTKTSSYKPGPLKTAEMKKLISSRMFGSKTVVKDLYEGCLFQIIRTSKVSVAYEVANSCIGKTFSVKAEGESYYFLMSRELPMEFLVKPNTVHFMFSSTRQILNHSHLDIKIKVAKM